MLTLQTDSVSCLALVLCQSIIVKCIFLFTYCLFLLVFLLPYRIYGEIKLCSTAVLCCPFSDGHYRRNMCDCQNVRTVTASRAACFCRKLNAINTTSGLTVAQRAPAIVTQHLRAVRMETSIHRCVTT